jgi:4-amino-4-deoxy-L-arabinose transferase-like glycosyltransferase
MVVGSRSRRISKYLYFFLIAIVALGGFLRFYHLGSLPIDGDNSYHALAVQAILQEGLPRMASGQIYTRSAPVLYLEALSARVFGYNEWSLRIPNALIGTLNIILVYLLAQTLLRDKKIAIITAFFFAISPWAVAMSRTPRMYEDLLSGVLLVWLLFFRWYYLKKKLAMVPLLIFSTITITLHKESIISLACFIAPLSLELEIRKENILSAGCFVGLFGLWWGYYSFLATLH